jgi:hypothetical protein
LARDGEQNEKERWINLIGELAGSISIKRPKEVIWQSSEVHSHCFVLIILTYFFFFYSFFPSVLKI